MFVSDLTQLVGRIGLGLPGRCVRHTYLLTTDITEQPIMFGRHGQLQDMSELVGRPGLGVDVEPSRLEPI